MSVGESRQVDYRKREGKEIEREGKRDRERALQGFAD